jgi:hypothetical protein
MRAAEEEGVTWDGTMMSFRSFSCKIITKSGLNSLQVARRTNHRSSAIESYVRDDMEQMAVEQKQLEESILPPDERFAWRDLRILNVLFSWTAYFEM